MMDDAATTRAAAVIGGARRRKEPLPGLPDGCRPKSPEEAYAIQDKVVRGLGQTIGWKVGATGKGAQELLGTDEPFRGRLIEGRCHDSPARLSVGDDFTTMCMIEIEFAFRLGSDLAALDAPHDRDSVAAAVEALVPSFEIIDSRYQDWIEQGVLQLIADNAVGGHFVMGAPVTAWRDTDLARHSVSIKIDGEAVSNGTGAQVLGHPLNSLVWLANDMASSGLSLKAGEIVTTGSCADIIRIEGGNRALGDFGDLGTVTIEFAD